MLTWEELAARSLARQFPAETADLVDLVARTGPIQSQAARAPFLGIAARRPGTTRDEIAAAHEEHDLVRGSTLRGTVHTSVADQHVLLEAGTRLGQRALWRRTLRLESLEVEDAWDLLEATAAEKWTTPADLHAALLTWLDEHDEAASREPMATTLGRAIVFGHGGLIRRPLGDGGWERQVAAGYRTAAVVLGEDRTSRLRDPVTIGDLLRLHLAAHGPASRHDLAWWSGIGLTTVDAALAGIETVEEAGPDGRIYLDLPTPPVPSTPPSVRLLPEFDALLCGYHPKARDRFVDPAHHTRLWNQANGVLAAPLLVDGRITGWWRAEGTGRHRRIEVSWFARTRRPRQAEVSEAAEIAATAMAWELDGVETTRAS